MSEVVSMTNVTGMVPMLSVTEMAHSSENNCSHFRPEKITVVLASGLVSMARRLVPGKGASVDAGVGAGVGAGVVAGVVIGVSARVQWSCLNRCCCVRRWRTGSW